MGWLSDGETVRRFQNWCGLFCCQRAYNHYHGLAGSDDDNNDNNDDDAGGGGSSASSGDHGRPAGRRRSARLKAKSDAAGNGPVKNGSVRSAERPAGVVCECWTKEKVRPFIGNQLLHCVFLVATEMGNELFYMTLFPFWYWSVESYAFRRQLVFWYVSIMSGQIFKDIVCWSRPRWPPVVQLESRYSSEYGMPSTHAMISLGIPLTLLAFSYQRMQIDIIYGLVVSLLWSSAVCLSRLYVGVHYPMDVLGGIGLLSLTTLVALPISQPVDYFLAHDPLAPLPLFLLPVLSAWLHPSLQTWTVTRSDNVMISCVFSGVYLGYWVPIQLGLYHDTVELNGAQQQLARFPAPGDTPLTIVVRFVVGVVVLAAARFTMKKISVFICSAIHKVDCSSEPNRRHVSIEIPYKMIVYIPMTFCCFCVCNPLFAWLGIIRSTQSWL